MGLLTVQFEEGLGVELIGVQPISLLPNLFQLIPAPLSGEFKQMVRRMGRTEPRCPASQPPCSTLSLTAPQRWPAIPQANHAHQVLSP